MGGCGVACDLLNEAFADVGGLVGGVVFALQPGAYGFGYRFVHVYRLVAAGAGAGWVVCALDEPLQVSAVYLPYVFTFVYVCGYLVVAFFDLPVQGVAFVLVNHGFVFMFALYWGVCGTKIKAKN